ncbi:MAG: N-acetylneuraminate synthase [Polynucleobacter sp. 39-45-136]|nr:MAG: N-acetylneuraminate synthase [Polynucleobacter sp. 39-45-136]
MTANNVFVIAEAGVNHNGSIALAKKLVDVAVESGADAVKFQSFKADSLVIKFAEKAEYQKKATGNNESQYEMLKKLELSVDEHQVLMSYCQGKKIQFLSTPFDCDSVDMLDSFDMPIFKIPSGEITNLPYLERIGRLNKRVILSTGMSNLSDIENALGILTESGTEREKISILHATTEYPCPIDEVNIRAMQTIKENFGLNVGYSDHTQGIEISIAAVALGASIIEKHFTLDRSMEGPDHKSSLEPYELKAMIKAIRNVEQALGDGFKGPTDSEKKNLAIARKSIVALQNIQKGELFSEQNLAIKRPGTGISPMRWREVMGKRAIRNFLIDELIEL